MTRASRGSSFASPSRRGRKAIAKPAWFITSRSFHEMLLGRTGNMPRLNAFLALCFGFLLFGIAEAQAQANVSRIALKSGESWEVGIAYFVRNCRSIMIGKPEIEVLEGAPEVTVTIK